jgi:hypothetical protein
MYTKQELSGISDNNKCASAIEKKEPFRMKQLFK